MGSLDKEHLVSKESKIVELTNAGNPLNVKSNIDPDLQAGWDIKGVYSVGAKVFVILVKIN